MASLVDINPEHLGIVREILRKNLPPGVSVWVFGSRVNGTAKESSDLDLALEGDWKLERRIIDTLKRAFEESNLSYAVDIIDLNVVNYKFQKIVHRQKILLSIEQTGTDKEWQNVNLGDLVATTRGRSYTSSQLQENANCALVTLKSFERGGGYRHDGLKPYIGPFSTEQIIQPGEIVIAQTDITQHGDVVGRPAMVPQNSSYHNLVASLDAMILRIIDKSRLNLRFLYYRLLSYDYVHHAKSFATGTTVLHLSTKAIPSFQFSLPPLQEQRTIAHILSVLDDKIELNRRMNQTLEGMARALFKSWFVDFDPVRAKMDGRWRRGESLPGLPAEYYDMFPDRLVKSELGEIPEKWKVTALGELLNVVGGSTPSTKKSEYWEDGIHCWATPKDLSILSVPILLNTKRKITDAGLVKISSSLLPAGTLLLSSRAPIGYLAISEVPTTINQGFIAMPPSGRMSNLFMLHWCSTFRDVIINYANGSTFLEISKNNFRLIKAIIPTKKNIVRFDKYVRPLYNRIVTNEKESLILTAKRNALLPKLVSGELRPSQSGYVVST